MTLVASIIVAFCLSKTLWKKRRQALWLYLTSYSKNALLFEVILRSFILKINHNHVAPPPNADLLVVIQYCIHVLYPDSIHRSIKYEPLPVWSLGGSKRSIGHGQYTIRPLVGDWVEWPVQLTHSDGLWVENCNYNLLLITQLLRTQTRTMEE